MSFFGRFFNRNNSNDNDDFEDEEDFEDEDEYIVECAVCGEELSISEAYSKGDDYFCGLHSDYERCHCDDLFIEDEMYLGFCPTCAEQEFRESDEEDSDAWDLAEYVEDKY